MIGDGDASDGFDRSAIDGDFRHAPARRREVVSAVVALDVVRKFAPNCPVCASIRLRRAEVLQGDGDGRFIVVLLLVGAAGEGEL